MPISDGFWTSPHANSDKEMATRVPAWIRMFDEHGKGISEAKKMSLFIGILPSHLQRKFSTEYSYKTFKDLHAHVEKLIVYDQHQRLARRDPRDRLHALPGRAEADHEKCPH